MRHREGEIVLSSAKDIPLLRRVWEAEVISPSQLDDLMTLQQPQLSSSRRALSNRLARLVKHGYLFRRSIVVAQHTTGYEITAKGVSHLLQSGQIVGHPTAMTNNPPSDFELLYLNALRINLMKQGMAEQWISRRDWLAQNQCLCGGMQNDELSARVTLKSKWGSIQVGISYEVPLRSSFDYQALEKRWMTTSTCHRIICVVAAEIEARWLARQLQTASTIHIAIQDDFVNSLLGAWVYRSDAIEWQSLADLLGRHPQIPLTFR